MPGNHFYTTSISERDNAIANSGYQPEGTACYVFDPQAPSTTSIGIGDHFYTTSVVERDNAVANSGYRGEGIACYVFANQMPQSVPIYRLLNPSNGDHF